MFVECSHHISPWYNHSRL